MLDWKLVGRVAQVVEQRPFKAWVAGSIPAALTNESASVALRREGLNILTQIRSQLEIMTMTIRCSAMLFDMDGVLIDSTPAVARVWHKLGG